ncbi:MAG TPA: hypothetical protein VK843_04170 [Planctomycetota bacterium]|nr:hypothetical protein [Planctomycetota bacterium]
MKLLPASIAGLALAALTLGGCMTPTAAQSNHWRIESIGPRISYHFFGYDGTKDGSGWDYTKKEAHSAGKTIKRRILGYNPDNPLTSDL